MSPNLKSLIDAVRRRQMTTPALLFIMGYRPLGFVLGQMLYVTAPMFEMLGSTGCTELAAFLSEPDSMVRLEIELTAGSTEPETNG